MHQFDKAVIDFVIKQFPHSYSFYKLVLFISDDNLLKGGVLVLLIWYLWFKYSDSLPGKRINIIITLFAAFTTIIISRFLTLLLPFVSRPILNSEFVYFPFETDKTSIDQLSSFPSDHAALFISLATGLLFVSKRAGIFALLYTGIFILFPRIYLGYHYPSDIIAGALIGIIVGIILNKSKIISNLISNKVMPFSKKYTQWFYPLFFLVTFEIVVLFGDFRNIVMFFIHHKI